MVVSDFRSAVPGLPTHYAILTFGIHFAMGADPAERIALFERRGGCAGRWK